MTTAFLCLSSRLRLRTYTPRSSQPTYIHNPSPILTTATLTIASRGGINICQCTLHLITNNCKKRAHRSLSLTPRRLLSITLAPSLSLNIWRTRHRVESKRRIYVYIYIYRLASVTCRCANRREEGGEGGRERDSTPARSLAYTRSALAAV